MSSYDTFDCIAPRNMDAEIKRFCDRTKGYNLLFDRNSELLPIYSSDQIMTQCMSYVANRMGSRLIDPADIWNKFFVHQTPISEPCRVIMTLFNKCGVRAVMGSSVSFATIHAKLAEIDIGKWKSVIRSSVLNPVNNAHVSSTCVDALSSFADLEKSTNITSNPTIRIVRCNNVTNTTAAVLMDCISHLNERKIVICANHYESLSIVNNLIQQSFEKINTNGHRIFIWSLEFGLYGSLVQMVASHREITNVTLLVPWLDTSLNSFHNICRDIVEKIGVDFMVCPCQNDNEETNFVHWTHIKSALMRVLSEKYRIVVFCGRSVTPHDIQRDIRHLLSGPPRVKTSTVGGSHNNMDTSQHTTIDQHIGEGAI